MVGKSADTRRPRFDPFGLTASHTKTSTTPSPTAPYSKTSILRMHLDCPDRPPHEKHDVAVKGGLDALKITVSYSSGEFHDRSHWRCSQPRLQRGSSLNLLLMLSTAAVGFIWGVLHHVLLLYDV